MSERRQKMGLSDREVGCLRGKATQMDGQMNGRQDASVVPECVCFQSDEAKS